MFVVELFALNLIEKIDFILSRINLTWCFVGILDTLYIIDELATEHDSFYFTCLVKEPIKLFFLEGVGGGLEKNGDMFQWPIWIGVEP